MMYEMLEQFFNHCSFCVYMKSEPAKYGIKMYALVDDINLLCFEIKIYAGQQPNGTLALSNSPSDTVKSLIMPVSGTGRNFTIDN